MPNVQARFSKNPAKPELGSNFHQQVDGQVPICFITDIKDNILIQHKPSNTSEWVVSRSRVNITRFWACSTAFIKCVYPLHDNDTPTPPLTTTSVFRPKPQTRDSSGIDDGDSQTQFPLGIGDEICIYYGYLNNLNENIDKKEIGKRFKRVFVGGIDTITEACNATEGVSVAIECRDRMKYLMDSISNYNAADSSRPTPPEEKGKPRKEVILELARSAVGDFSNNNTCSSNGCGYKIVEGTIDSSNYEVDYFYNKKDAEGSLVVTHEQQKSVSVMPKYYIQSSRESYGEQENNFPIVVDKLTIDYTKYMSLQEVYYTEVFAHHVTGDYYYAPRYVSTHGLNSKELLYRTYFSRITPPGLGKLYGSDKDIVHPGQMAIAYQEENSLISWRSNVIIRDEASGAAGTFSNILHVKSTPARFKERGFPCSYQFVTDSTLKKPTEFAAVAIAYIRRISKPVRAAELHLLGDPSLSPGELIQVVGAMPKDSYAQTPLDVLDQAYKDRKNAIQYADLYKKEIESTQSSVNGDKTVSETSSSDTVNLDNITGVSVNGPIQIQQVQDGLNIYCSSNSPSSDSEGASSNASSTVSTGDKVADITAEEDIKSMWRIENIRHQFNDGKPGFYSVLALTNPY